MAAGKWDGRADQALNGSEKAQVRRLQGPASVHTELATPRTPCGIFRKVVLFVSPTGDVTPCPFVPDVFGNVQRVSLADIWRLHCDGLQTLCRGECPTNLPETREALRRHVESVARELASP
jgi:MoaA/NifB/PqqE/SkfB family radical SAM enzyme